jgi:tRNA(Arg) A34 adenosine deaminase TadA
MNDVDLMREARVQAEAAFNRGECAVGALLVLDGQVIARAGNREHELHDPTAHAEILVLREAGRLLGTHTFPDCVVYTTLWPCPMCQSAMLRAKVGRVVCGARSFKYIYDVTFNPTRLPKSGPIMEDACRDVFVRWVKSRSFDEILEYESSDEAVLPNPWQAASPS